MILGQSGTGKSASLRNLPPSDALLIQSVRKPLPFKSAGWKLCTKADPSGSILVTDSHATIVTAMKRTQRKIIVIDDFQYVMCNEFMQRSDERGYDKFTEIARHAWDVLMCATHLDDDKRVYILSHTQQDENGVKAKTIGKMLDEKITVEGLVSIVLRTKIVNSDFLFRTRNDGSDTTKTPMGMFDDELIPNDLALVDRKICEFYEIAT